MIPQSFSFLILMKAITKPKAIYIRPTMKAMIKTGKGASSVSNQPVVHITIATTISTMPDNKKRKLQKLLNRICFRSFNLLP